MYNSNSDSDAYLTATQRLEQYLSLPSVHEQVGKGAVDQDHEMQEENEYPTLNASEPDDYEGSPIDDNEYIDMPLSPEYADLLSIKIKRVAFVRQKVRDDLKTPSG